MTVKEMDAVIQANCHANCETCVVQSLCNSVGGCFDSNPKVCEQAYNLIMENMCIDNPVSHPSHYNQGNIECIDAMVAAFGKEATATFCHINAFKYLWRTEHKNGIQDIDKAIWYLNKFKELKASGE